MTKIELTMDTELARVIAYIKDELKDAIVADEMQAIIDAGTEGLRPADRRYYRILVGAAEIIREHYTVSGHE